MTIVILSGCAAQTSDAGEEPSSPTSSATPGESEPASTADAGMVDVDGRGLYLGCTGTGSPTVVYVHGWVNDENYVPHESAQAISELLADDYRVCLYDRRNVGSSETLDAVQTPDDMRHDMEAVLANGGVEPPYILMAASFGGLVAYDYLNHHPDQVTGLVLLDAMFPDELALDEYLPSDSTFLHYSSDDMCCTLERISQYDLISGLQQYIGHEPAVPMVYLASLQEPRDENDYGSPEYDARVLDSQQAFVDRFTPGELRWVDAPHFMEPAIPGEIAQAVRDVVAMASAD